jgi:hypothetical protein
VLDREGVIQARLLQHLLEMIGGLPSGSLTSLIVGGSYEGTLVVPLVLLLPLTV